MGLFEHTTGRQLLVSGAAVEAAYAADPEWTPVEEPKPLTPKQRLQQDAAALGLSTDGTADDITARIDAKAVELRKQAHELDIDPNGLTLPELAATIESALA